MYIICGYLRYGLHPKRYVLWRIEIWHGVGTYEIQKLSFIILRLNEYPALLGHKLSRTEKISLKIRNIFVYVYVHVIIVSLAGGP